MLNEDIKEDIKIYVNTIGRAIAKAIKEHKTDVCVNLPIENIDVKTVVSLTYLVDKNKKG